MSKTDSYSIYNHPFLLDKPGEYYITSNGTGGYNLYLIPRDTANLGNLKLPSLYSAFILWGAVDYITIEGFEVRGYSGSTWSGGVTSRSNSSQHHVTVKNNYFHHMSTDSVILFYGGIHNTSEGNRFDHIKKGSAIRYSVSDYATVKNNEIDNVSSSTFIRFQDVDNGVIFGTVGSGGGDNHSQGISLYIKSSNILVMNNHLKDVAAGLTYNTGENFSLIGNVFDSESRNTVAFWQGTY